MENQRQTEMAPERVRWMRECPRRLMVGLHIADYDQLGGEYAALRAKGVVPGILEKLDVRELARALRRAHVQAFWFYSKGGFGNAFYPSRVGHVLSALNGRDLFGEMCEACLSEGIVPLGIYECSDLRIRKEHPEWCRLPLERVKQGRIDINDREDLEVGSGCVCGPYGDFVIAQTREVLKAYPIRGYYLDALGGGGGSGAGLCHVCAKAFRDMFGFDFPGADALPRPQFVKYLRWRISQLADYTRKVRGMVADLRPDVAFTYNYCGVPGHCDFVTCDAFQFRQGMLHVDTMLRRNAALSRHLPAEVLLDGVQDDFHTPKALDSYRAEMWTARSLNVAACSSFVMPVDGTVPFQTINLARAIFEEQRGYEPWLKDMETVFTVGILNSHDTRKYRPAETDTAYPNQTHHQLDYQGWAQAAVAGHHLWDHLEDSLITAERLARFKVVVLPNASCLSPGQVQAIESFVRNGGALIATGDTSLFTGEGEQQKDFQLASVFGVNFLGLRSRKLGQLKIEEKRLRPGVDRATDTLCFEDGQCWIKAAPSARVLGSVLQKPMFHANPAVNDLVCLAVPTESPGLVEHAYGKGRCFYMAGLAGLLYSQQGRYPFRRLMVEVLKRAAGKSAPVAVDAPDTVEVFAHRQAGKNRLVVNMVNTVSGCVRSVPVTRYEDMETIPAVPEVRVRFRKPGRGAVKRVYLAPDRKALRPTRKGAETEVVLHNVGVHAMLVAEYA